MDSATDNTDALEARTNRGFSSEASGGRSQSACERCGDFLAGEAAELCASCVEAAAREKLAKEWASIPPALLCLGSVAGVMTFCVAYGVVEPAPFTAQFPLKSLLGGLVTAVTSLATLFAGAFIGRLLLRRLVARSRSRGQVFEQIVCPQRRPRYAEMLLILSIISQPLALLGLSSGLPELGLTLLCAALLLNIFAAALLVLGGRRLRSSGP